MQQTLEWHLTTVRGEGFVSKDVFSSPHIAGGVLLPPAHFPADVTRLTSRDVTSILSRTRSGVVDGESTAV